MRKTIQFSFAALLIGCLAAACSGGGGSSSLPAAPHGSTPAVRQNVAFTITVPAAVTSAARSPKYVSASTQSVSVVETDGAASASPAVVQNTTPGSPNCTSAGSGTSCTITVQANVGSDSFAVKTYDQTNAGGNLLSSGTVSGTVVAGQANTFPLVLGGTVASLSLIAANAYPQVGTSTTISPAAKDADGNTIIGPYDSAVAVSTSANATLSAASLASSSDSLTVALGSSQTASFTVDGSVNGHTGSATLNPSSGVVYYPLQSTDPTSFQMAQGSDGKLYYSTLGALVCASSFCSSTSGHIGQFDPSTGADHEIALDAYEPAGLYQTSDGTVWAALTQWNETTGARDGYIATVPGSAFTSSNMSVIPVPTASPDNHSTTMRNFALGADGFLYATGNGDHTLYKIPVMNPSTSNITRIVFPKQTPEPGGPYPYAMWPQLQGIAANADGNLYIADHAFAVSNVFQLNPATQAIATFGFPNTSQLDDARYVASGTDGNLYVTTNTNCVTTTTASCPDALYKMTTGGTYTQIPLPDGMSAPDFISAGNGILTFADLGDGALGVYQISSGDLRDYPIAPIDSPCCTVWPAPNAALQATDGTIWFVTYGIATAGGKISMGHVVMTTNWSVWPAQSISLYGTGAAGEQLIGIMESGDSGPFKLGTSDASVASLQPISGFSHNFELVGSGPGSCTVTITDKNGRSEQISVSVTSTSGTVQTAPRPSKGDRF